MAMPTEIGGDVVAAGGAIAGLMLVYMGSLSAGYASYPATGKKAVRGSYQRRIWFAFAGLIFNALSIPCGLEAKALDDVCVLFLGLAFLLLGMVWLVVAAILTALEIK